jgi:hypothetical protein
MLTVIVLGSSRLAREAYATARRMAPEARVITCNRGLEIEAHPDFYFLSDCTACQLFSRAGKQASKTGKTLCVTLRRDAQAMKMRTVDDFDLVVREGHPFEPFQLSGIWCQEFAIRVVGAQRLILAGCDGYQPTVGLGDYFPGSTRIAESEGLGKDLTRTVIDPLMNRIVAKYPHVSFCLVGQPCYEICLPNWQVIAPSP